MRSEVRESIFNEVLRLREKGLSYNGIIERIRKIYGIQLSKSTISYWVSPPNFKGAEKLSDRRAYKLEPCPALAYILGAAAGDGYVKRDRKRYHYLVCLGVKDYEFAEKFSRCATIALKRMKPYNVYWDARHQRWETRVCSKNLYNLVFQLKRGLIEVIKPYVESSKECMIAFIRGLADAEGSVSRDPGNFFVQIVIVNTDFKLLNYARELLEKLGIETKTYTRMMGNHFIAKNGKRYKRRKTMRWELRIIKRAEIEKFCELIGFTIYRKQAMLEAAIQRRKRMRQYRVRGNVVIKK